VRPKQCRAFPFWDGNLENKREWNETARACEGIGRGPLITEEEILERLFEGMKRQDS
jgi:Fe-S-cluster containining protein